MNITNTMQIQTPDTQYVAVFHYNLLQLNVMLNQFLTLLRVIVRQRGFVLMFYVLLL